MSNTTITNITDIQGNPSEIPLADLLANMPAGVTLADLLANISTPTSNIALIAPPAGEPADVLNVEMLTTISSTTTTISTATASISCPIPSSSASSPSTIYSF